MKNVAQEGVVKIVKNHQGNDITPFYNAKYGFIVLSTDRLVNGQLETVSCRVKQTIENLELLIYQKFSNGMMSGTILIQEYLESQVPELTKKGYNENWPYEKAVIEHFKINPATGLPVIIEGQRVVRFTQPIDSADFIAVESLIVEYHPPV